MKRFRAIVFSSSLSGLVLIGCENEECERQRFEVSDRWEHVVSVAGRRAVSAAETGGATEAWKGIKEQAELVHSSFATPQVTWAAAKNGRSKLRAQFKPFEGNEETRAFKLAIEQAEQAHDAFESSCR